MPTQAEKGRTFRALHERDHAFLIPNPWDAGSARLLTHMGFEALATTSAGYAYSTGRPDHGVARDEMLAHAAAIVSATDLPVTADLENGFGDTPEIVAVTIRLAGAAGLAGCSIEDAAGGRVYGREHAAERIRAAVEAARGLPFPFTLTARAENFITGRPDLADTIQRLQAYQEAGADVLYAPGIASLDEVAEVTCSVDRPVNVLAPLPGNTWSLESLSKLGVRRVSVGGALYRAAMGGFLRAVREMREHGTFGFAKEAASSEDLARMWR
jgi:2-methylisocitrate lyase-like PEP mutase family enzyme